jgi:hypothetical protein
METASIVQNSSTTSYRPNFLHQILARTALVIGGFLTIVWIAFLGYEIVRLFEVAL